MEESVNMEPDAAFLAASRAAEAKARGEEPAPEPEAEHPDVALLRDAGIDPEGASAFIDSNPELQARLDQLPLESEADVLRRGIEVERAAREAEQQRLARLGELAQAGAAVEEAAERYDYNGEPITDLLSELEQTHGAEAAQALAERVAAEEAAYENEPETAAEWLAQRNALAQIRQAAAVAAAQRQQAEAAAANLAAVEKTIADFQAEHDVEALLPAMSTLLTEPELATRLLFGTEADRRSVLEDAAAGAQELARAQQAARAQAMADLEGQRWAAQGDTSGTPSAHVVDQAAAAEWVAAREAQLLASKVDHARIAARGLPDRAIQAMQQQVAERDEWYSTTKAMAAAGQTPADIRRNGIRAGAWGDVFDFGAASREAETKARGRR